MSSDQDQSQKTEEPTEKKLRDAHKRGEVAKSQEINTWFVLGAGTLMVAFLGPTMMGGLKGVLSEYLARPHAFSVRGEDLLNMISGLGQNVLLIMAMPLGLLVLAAIVGNMVQHKPVFTAERMKPKGSKISPIKGFKRIFGMMALVNFAKGLAKLGIVATIAFVIIWPQHEQLATLVTRDLSIFFPYIKGLALQMLGGVMAVLTVIAALDFMYQKFDFTKRQRMTKQEVKDEHKQAEGDPHLKAKLRQLRMERGRKRMMAEVPEASVVITNPTHFAVALKYEQVQMSAPICVAKGADNVAFRIREMAKEHGVPIVENPPLARALFATVELDDEVPPDHYKAVAEVIGYVMRLKNKAGARAS